MSSKVFRIFLVEDNPADVYLLRQALHQAGLHFELTVIDDGTEALEFVRSRMMLSEMPKPDLAVLDINLPGHGGIEVLEAIRQNEDLADIPVAVVTSSDALPDRTQVERLGVARFITKPHNLADYLEIGSVLKQVLLSRETRPGSP